jgi:hypothetical protein
VFDSVLSDDNHKIVENYLSQKYDLDVENGLNFENKNRVNRSKRKRKK